MGGLFSLQSWMLASYRRQMLQELGLQLHSTAIAHDPEVHSYEHAPHQCSLQVAIRHVHMSSLLKFNIYYSIHRAPPKCRNLLKQDVIALSHLKSLTLMCTCVFESSNIIGHLHKQDSLLWFQWCPNYGGYTVYL